MFKTKRDDQIMRWMAAACVASGMMLAGCESSTDPAHAARTSGVEAARIMAAAGDPKVTDALYNLVVSGATSVPEGKLKDYVKTEASDKDLEASVARLTGKINGDLSPGVKSALEMQMGAAQVELSQARLALLQADIQDLTRQAISLQSMAQAAVEMGAQAATVECGAKAPSKADSDAAAAAVTQRQRELSVAEEKVKSIQAQITAKDGQARKIYADTDAAFLAADGMKGAQAISSGGKAMQDRKAADQLMAEIGNLSPELARANGDLALARVALGEAQSLAKSTADSYAAALSANEKTAQRAKDLRAASLKIVTDKGGVKEALAAFMETASKVDARVKAAVSASDAAVANFTSASRDLRAARDEAKKIVEERALESSDPLAKFSKDDRLLSMIVWSQSAASQQGGRVLLVAADTMELAGVAAKISAEAFKAAGQTADSSLPANTYRADAVQHFTTAVDVISGNNKMPAPSGSDLEKVRWIGYGLEATAQHGLYLASNNAAALAAAKTAQANAAKFNPAGAAELSWLDNIK